MHTTLFVLPLFSQINPFNQGRGRTRQAGPERDRTGRVHVDHFQGYSDPQLHRNVSTVIQSRHHTDIQNAFDNTASNCLFAIKQGTQPAIKQLSSLERDNNTRRWSWCLFLVDLIGIVFIPVARALPVLAFFLSYGILRICAPTRALRQRT